jgi:hypothetical protein
MRRLKDVLLTTGLISGLWVGVAHGVVVDITIESEGEPVPQVEISFETLDGEPLDLALLEVPDEAEPPAQMDKPEEPKSDQSVTEETKTDEPKTEVTDASQPDKPEMTSTDQSEPGMAETPKDEPSDGMAMTREEPEGMVTVTADEQGRAQVSLPDEMIGQAVIAVIRQGDKIVKLHEVTPSEEPSETVVEAFDPADALIGASISQAGKDCKNGGDCAFELVLTNDGTGIFEGPVFFEGDLEGDWVSGLSQLETFHCGPGRRGKILCQVDLSLQPGEGVGHPTTIALPRNLTKSSKNCLQVVSPATDPGTRSKPLMSAIQLGLTKQGFDAGRADGVDGPKTRRAVQAYLQEVGIAETPTDEGLFEQLYGYPLAKLGRLGTSDQLECSKVAVLDPVVAVKKAKKRTAKKPRTATTKRRAVKKTSAKPAPVKKNKNETLRRAVGIGISIGIGVLNSKQKRKKHYPHH